jgi:hypothetical protein
MEHCECDTIVLEKDSMGEPENKCHGLQTHRHRF